MLKNPYVRALAGGLVAALTVAGPLVDNGVTASEAIAVVLAFLTGSGLTAAPARAARVEGKHRAERTFL